MPGFPFDSVDELQAALGEHSLLGRPRARDGDLLSLSLGKPLLLEGEAGVGKTEVAKTLSHLLGRDLIGCSATRASTHRRPCTSGTTRGG